LASLALEEELGPGRIDQLDLRSAGWASPVGRSAMKRERAGRVPEPAGRAFGADEDRFRGGLGRGRTEPAQGSGLGRQTEKANAVAVKQGEEVARAAGPTRPVTKFMAENPF